MRSWKEKRYLPLILVGMLCFASLLVMSIALGMEKKQEPAEFIPPSFEEAAVTGSPEVPQELGWSELDAGAFKVAVCGNVVIRDGSADVWFTNVETNTVWMKLRILDTNGEILGETGLIRQGEFVRSIAFDKLPEDGGKIILKVMAYEPETYYSEGSVALNTTAKVGG